MQLSRQFFIHLTVHLANSYLSYLVATIFWATITTVGPEEDKHRLLIQVFEYHGAKFSGKKMLIPIMYIFFRNNKGACFGWSSWNQEKASEPFDSLHLLGGSSSPYPPTHCHREPLISKWNTASKVSQKHKSSSNSYKNCLEFYWAYRKSQQEEYNRLHWQNILLTSSYKRKWSTSEAAQRRSGNVKVKRYHKSLSTGFASLFYSYITDSILQSYFHYFL